MSADRFLRTRQILGDEALARLGAAHVAVVGIGAVGSYATEALARSGVGHLRLVDGDLVQPSNINRQLMALESTLGRPKVDVAAARVVDINPQCAVEPLRLFVDADSLGPVLTAPLDLVVDAIDSAGPKLELIAAALRSGIPIVSSMGAALRVDPTRVRTGVIADVQGCPLARRLRRGLRGRGLGLDVPCVFSEEPATRAWIGPSEDPQGPGPTARRRALGSLPTVTGTFGLVLAALALRMLSVERPGP
ncbi:MAG TPA: tRNA threonylcarbamoyladenosine dehydratase [Armatimonadota bacterium]|nr:tRNA threonylcarbamoyladenosine dehydratase [Armatimonadota bacterium]